MISPLRKHVSFRLCATALIVFFALAAFHAKPTQAGPATHPVPFISVISPLKVAPGGEAFTVTVRGANFTGTSVVHWGSTALTTTYVSRAELTAVVPANLIASDGTGWITVVNPAPRGGASNIAYLQVNSSSGNFSPTGFSYHPGTVCEDVFFYSAGQGDFNGDGKMDLVGVDYNGAVWVFLGNGDGTFQTGVPWGDAYGAYGVAVGDINGDGKLDLVVQEASSNFSFVVHLGNGDGTFQPATTIGSVNIGYEPALADINGDGYLDIVSVDHADHILYFQGNGDGTFQDPVTAGTLDGGPLTIAVGDFDGDGILDLAAVNPADTVVTLFKGVGDGTFLAAQTFTGQGAGLVATAGDFNEDGWLDFLGGAGEGNTSTLLLNNSGSGFATSTPLSLGSDVQAITSADLNGDGHADIIASSSRGFTISYGAGNGTFSDAATYNSSVFYGESITVGNYVTGGGLGFAVPDYDTGGLDVFLATLDISPSPLDFGNVAVNSTPAPMLLTVTNNTPTTVSLTGASLAGANGSEFAIAGSTCGATLASAATCTESITFTPAAAGARTATFSLSDTAAGGTQTAQLTGTGVDASAVSLTPPSIAFPGQNPNSTSTARVVTLKNTGDATLNFTSIVLGGANAAEFAETSTCSEVLAVNATCTISVTFTPAASSAYTATVAITDDALDSPQNIAISGSGISDPVSLSSTALTFTARMITSTSAAQNVVLTNIGSGALSIASISIAGANNGDFAQTSNCGSSVASEATCNIAVTFTPTASGSRSATLSIADGSAQSPHTVALTGTGQDFTFAVSAPQTVAPGSSAAFQLTIAPVDGLTQMISFTCANSILHSTCSVAPASITTDGATSDTVTLTVTTTGRASSGNLPAASPDATLPPHSLHTPVLLVFIAFFGLGISRRRSLITYRAAGMIFGALVLTFAALAITACGCASSSKQTPGGAYTVTVTGTSGGLSHSVTAHLTVQ
ncbi:MAG: choice-of-anchor D domain-containing protein [Candidatus Acidiferrales bacterium]